MTGFELSRRELCFATVGAALLFPAEVAAFQSPAGRGLIYGVDPGGRLLWYRHEGRGDGSFRWTSNEGREVGIGWAEMRHVFSGGDGLIYAVDPGGRLLWYRHEGRGDGSFRWTSNQGREVGVGWAEMRHVFGA